MKKIVTGVIIVLIGIILLFHNLGFFPSEYFRLVFSWQSLLIAIGTIQLADRHPHAKDTGIVLIFAGLAFLTSRILALFAPGLLDGVNMNRLIFSVIIIIIGIFFIVRSLRRKTYHRFFDREKSNSCHDKPFWKRRHHHYHAGDFESAPFTDMPVNDPEYIKREYVFTGSKERIVAGAIRRVEIEAVFSGVEIDLSQVEFSPDAQSVHIKVSSVFSGVTLYLPAEWNVLIQKTGVFGGFVDKRSGKFNPDSGGKPVILELEAVFGGGEIRCYE